MITRPSTSNIHPAAHVHTHPQESLLIIKAKKTQIMSSVCALHYRAGQGTVLSAPQQETLLQV